jgi:hypothetical protein
MTNLEKVLNGEDYKSFVAKASDLTNLGWDFSGENDAQFFNMDEADFIENGEINITVHEDGTTYYLSSPEPCDWQNADAHNETGDDAKTLEDIIELQAKGLISER